LGNLRAEAATPEDVLVMGKTIDNMIAMDPAQAYEFSDSEFDGNICMRRPGAPILTIPATAI
jgi:peptide/nickel transport system substrate-binding protein